MPCDSVITMSVNLENVSFELLRHLYPELIDKWDVITLDNGVEVGGTITSNWGQTRLIIQTDSTEERNMAKAKIMTGVQRHVVQVAAERFGWKGQAVGDNTLIIRR